MRRPLTNIDAERHVLELDTLRLGAAVTADIHYVGDVSSGRLPATIRLGDVLAPLLQRMGPDSRKGVVLGTDSSFAPVRRRIAAKATCVSGEAVSALSGRSLWRSRAMKAFAALLCFRAVLASAPK
jgi:hypothetical protein